MWVSALELTDELATPNVPVSTEVSVAWQCQFRNRKPQTNAFLLYFECVCMCVCVLVCVRSLAGPVFGDPNSDSEGSLPSIDLRWARMLRKTIKTSPKRCRNTQKLNNYANNFSKIVLELLKFQFWVRLSHFFASIERMHLSLSMACFPGVTTFEFECNGFD